MAGEHPSKNTIVHTGQESVQQMSTLDFNKSLYNLFLNALGIIQIQIPQIVLNINIHLH